MKRPISLILLFYFFGIFLYENYIFSKFSILLIFILISIFFIFSNFSYKSIVILFLSLGLLFTSIREEKIIENSFSKKTISIYEIDNSKNISYGKILEDNRKVIIYDDLELGYNYNVLGKYENIISNDNFSFSYENFLKTKDIYNGFKIIKIYERNKSSNFFINLKISFNNLIESSTEDLEDSSKEIVKSIILSKGENKTFNNMRYVGLSHLIAISGLHINLIYNLFFSIGKIFKIKREILVFISISILLLYAYFIGFRPSVLRAIFMLIIMEISLVSKNIYDPINALYLSTLIILIINPFNIYDSGLLLSFFASFIIYGIYPFISYIFPSDRKYFKDLYFLLILQIFLLPIELYLFGKFNFINIIGNILIGPIFNLLVNFILLTLIFGSFMYLPISIVVEGLINILNFLLKILSKVDFLNINLYLTKNQVVLIYFFLLFFIYIKKYSFKRKLIKRYLNILLLFLPIFLIYFYPKGELIMLDVGQGDAFIIRKGNINICFDTGGSLSKSRGEKLVSDIKSLGIRDIDLLILSHDDYDHIGYLDIFIENFLIKEIFTSYEFDNVNSSIIENEKKVIIGDFYIKFFVDKKATSSNNKSLVSYVKYKNISILMTGDFENDKFLISKVKNVDILKVSHHGSKNGTSQELLDKIMPKISLISVGENNRYSHPNDEVINRLKSINSKIYRTDINKGVSINLDNGRIYLAKGKEDIFSIFTIENILYSYIFILIYIYLSSKESDKLFEVK